MSKGQERNIRKFKGFAVLDRRGSLLWGTIRRTADEARSQFGKWNPDPAGEGHGEELKEVTIYISVENNN